MALELSTRVFLPLVAVALTLELTSACCMPDKFSITINNMGEERWDLAIFDFTVNKMMAYVLGKDGDYILVDDGAAKMYTRLEGKCSVTNLPNRQYLPQCIPQDATLVYESPNVAGWEINNDDVKETWMMSRENCFPMSALLVDKKTGGEKIVSFADPAEIPVPATIFDVDLSDCVEA